MRRERRSPLAANTQMSYGGEFLARAKEEFTLGIVSFRSEFDEHDIDKDGLLTLTEFRQAVAGWPGTDASKAQAILDAFDSDGDGCLDFHDYSIARSVLHSTFRDDEEGFEARTTRLYEDLRAMTHTSSVGPDSMKDSELLGLRIPDFLQVLSVGWAFCFVPMRLRIQRRRLPSFSDRVFPTLCRPPSERPP